MILSIVITTRDRKKDLMACIKSIKSSDIVGINLELIVIDDASSDGTQLLKAGDLEFPNSKIIHLSKQVMMVASRNAGAKEARGELVLFIDDDNEVDRKMIKTLVEFGSKNSVYGILGPSHYYFDTKTKYLDYQKINLCTGYTAGVVSTEKKEVFESDGVPNVFMVRKEVFNKCGYFDDSLIQTYTEPDFAMKSRANGYLCGVVLEAKTYHKVKRGDSFKPRGLGGMFNQKAYCLVRNRTVYISRYGNFLNKTVYIIALSLFWPVSYSLLALINRRNDLLKLYWLGFVDGVRYFFTGKLKNSLMFK